MDALLEFLLGRSPGANDGVVGGNPLGELNAHLMDRNGAKSAGMVVNRIFGQIGLMVRTATEADMRKVLKALDLLENMLRGPSVYIMYEATQHRAYEVGETSALAVLRPSDHTDCHVG